MVSEKTNRVLLDRGQSIIKTHKNTGALSFFKIRERNKDESIAFDLKRARKDKGSNDLLSLMSRKYQMTALGDLGKIGLSGNCELHNTSWRTKKYRQAISPNAVFSVS